ncbi:hypothetical protein LCGC14_1429370 [marine sediment metagenome]|uniref:D-isomer specific 2-hydroxyacid dehydrogenase catalytic domain-containing protein n=1 Tax=marine sediment metagenome TaxID=412755 RepID=A0A0F9JPC3_9ZZZZ
MKVLYFIKDEPGDTLKAFIDEHKKTEEVTVMDIRSNKNYDEIIDLIDQSDKVISI